MEADAERVTEEGGEQPEAPARSAWELIDEEWEQSADAPMCM